MTKVKTTQRSADLGERALDQAQAVQLEEAQLDQAQGGGIQQGDTLTHEVVKHASIDQAFTRR